MIYPFKVLMATKKIVNESKKVIQHRVIKHFRVIKCVHIHKLILISFYSMCRIINGKKNRFLWMKNANISSFFYSND